MAGKRVRGLDQQFIDEILPLFPNAMGSDVKVDPDVMRNGMAALKEGKAMSMKKYWSNLLEDTVAKNITIMMRDGHQTEMRIITPNDAPLGHMPVYYGLHGGGFVTGDNDSEELINRQLCDTSKAICFSLNYRLAPENPVETTILQDVEDGLHWVYNHAAEFGGDTSQGIFVGGTSAGGLMCCVMGYRANKLGVPVRGIIMRQAAMMIGNVEKESWKPELTSLEENADAPMVNKKALETTNDILKIPQSLLTDPWYFPIFAPDFSKLPPHYIVGAGCDPHADHCTLYGRFLAEAGVPVKVKIYDHMPHGFHSWHQLKAARDEMVDTSNGFKWLISLNK